MTLFEYNTPLEPPGELDGAQVQLWAYDPLKPFFIMEYSDGRPGKPIHGFAICQYKGEKKFYKFSCDSEWNVENDLDCDSVDEAMSAAQDMTAEAITWIKKI